MDRVRGDEGAAGAAGHRARRPSVLSVLLAVAAFAGLLAGCSGTGVTGATYQNHRFEIFATTSYDWQLVEDSGTTTGTSSSDQSFTISAVSGQQYTLTAWKSAADGTSLEVELVAFETVNGVATSVVVDSQTTTSPEVAARVTLYQP